jgi:hypothetical protein
VLGQEGIRLESSEPGRFFRPRGRAEDPAMDVQETLLSPNHRRKEAEQEMTVGPAAKQETAKTPPSVLRTNSTSTAPNDAPIFVHEEKGTYSKFCFWKKL